MHFARIITLAVAESLMRQMWEKALSPPWLASGKQLCPQPEIFYFFLLEICILALSKWNLNT